ncbi:MAG: lipocalin-like domain-containing protein, partial [Muribaculaceae bacterium]|nr:lipocalin-like domain-containing protein [Muribaculaceae bacterium]
MRILIKHLIAGVIACLTLSGCMQHNGDIGDWFGKWQVMEIRVDGVAETDYEPRYFWEFQNDIIRLVWVGPNGYDRDT